MTMAAVIPKTPKTVGDWININRWNQQEKKVLRKFLIIDEGLTDGTSLQQLAYLGREYIVKMFEKSKLETKFVLNLTNLMKDDFPCMSNTK